MSLKSLISKSKLVVFRLREKLQKILLDIQFPMGILMVIVMMIF